MPLFLANLNEEEIFFVGLPILSVLIAFLTAVITSHYRKLRRDDMEATLKMEMIERGMSADEIEQVLAARIGSPSRHRRREARGYAPRAGAAQREA